MACEVGGRKPLEELGKKTDPESWAMYLVQQEVFNADNAERTRLREYASTKNLREIVRQTNCDAKAIEEFLIKEHLWIPEVQPMVQALAEFRDKYGVDYRDAEAE
ncbi:MAG: hypothetical protein E4H02_06475 [Lentisphaerales bacterium]|nr:MAG: hypothetical protein E4H02_06475 [Lentisphaerales bacterium]